MGVAHLVGGHSHVAIESLSSGRHRRPGTSRELRDVPGGCCNDQRSLANLRGISYDDRDSARSERFTRRTLGGKNVRSPIRASSDRAVATCEWGDAHFFIEFHERGRGKNVTHRSTIAGRQSGDRARSLELGDPGTRDRFARRAIRSQCQGGSQAQIAHGDVPAHLRDRERPAVESLGADQHQRDAPPVRQR